MGMMAETLRWIDSGLLVDGFHVLERSYLEDGSDLGRHDPTIGPCQVDELLIEALIDEILANDELDDDHSVGICSCWDREVVEQLRLALNGRRRCRVCGGDGWIEVWWHQPACRGYTDRGYECDSLHQFACAPTLEATRLTWAEPEPMPTEAAWRVA